MNIFLKRTENNSVGKAISAGRSKSGLTQKALGEKLGVERITISRWERGESLPTVDKLYDIACALSLAIRFNKHGVCFYDEEDSRSS